MCSAILFILKDTTEDERRGYINFMVSEVHASEIQRHRVIDTFISS